MKGENMEHYNLESQSLTIRRLAAEGKLKGPKFIGQGATRSIGSDCYGYYVSYISEDKKTCSLKPADAAFTKCWEDGNQTCTMPAKTNPDSLVWLKLYGGSWYAAKPLPDGSVQRLKGCKCHFSWNGAYGYQDPSF